MSGTVNETKKLLVVRQGKGRGAGKKFQLSKEREAAENVRNID